MKKNFKETIDDETECVRKERDNGIERDVKSLRHPHEMTMPVGEDERDYLNEELKEQGYTEKGLDNPNQLEGDHAQNHNHEGRKLA